MDSKIKFSVNFKYKSAKKVRSENCNEESHQDTIVLSPAPTIDSKTGAEISNSNWNIYPESSKNSIYLMQNLKIGKSDCLTFFDSGANTHFIDGELKEKEKLQLISSNHTALGVIGGGSVMTEFGNFRFNLGSGEDKIFH